MLKQLVSDICDRIDALAPQECIPELRNQVQWRAPDAVQRIVAEMSRPQQPATLDVATLMGASLVFLAVKSIAGIARQMLNVVYAPNETPGRRCTTGTSLVYLVQPRDLIPDDAPGGYGYLDDAILLRAGLVEYLGLLPQGQNLDAERRFLSSLIGLAPPETRQPLQEAIGAMSTWLQLTSMLDPFAAQPVLAQVINNPLATSMPAAPPSFTPRMPYDYGRGHWNAGAYFEGDDVVIPGGPSLINGELFIPDL